MMKKHKGFYLGVLGLFITAVPLFTDGGKVYSVLGPVLVLFGVLSNGLGRSKAGSERKPISRMNIIQLGCLTASLLVVIISAYLQLDPVTVRTRARPISMLLTMIAVFLPEMMKEDPEDAP